MIAVGSKVKWTYQAGGIEFAQAGVVLSFVKAEKNAANTFKKLGIEATSRQKKFAETSSNDRYLVEVKDNGTSYFYAPTASVLETQNPKVANSGADVAVATQVAPAQVVSKTRKLTLGATYTKGNGTKYTVFAFDAGGGLAAYRIIGAGTLKFVLDGRVGKKASDSYKSSVRDAQCMYCKPILENTEDYASDMTSVEAGKYVKRVGEYFEGLGYQGSVDTMMKEIQKNATGKGTRRNIGAQFYGK